MSSAVRAAFLSRPGPAVTIAVNREATWQAGTIDECSTARVHHGPRGLRGGHKVWTTMADLAEALFGSHGVELKPHPLVQVREPRDKAGEIRCCPPSAR